MSQPPPQGYPTGPQPGMPNAPTQHLPAAGGPPQGPPPGFPSGPPPQFATHNAPYAGQRNGPRNGPYSGPGGAPATRSKAGTAVSVLALISVAATVIGLTVEEDGRNAWDTVNAWGALAILGAVLTFAPAVRTSLNLSAHRAWQVAACGAGALALFWVLFVLPAAGSNTSLVTTVGAAAGIIAAWVAPGRDDARGGPGGSGPTW